MLFQIKRLAGYILGFCLFYAPFALFQKSILYLFTSDWSELNIHDVCFRIQTEHLLDGKLFTMATPFIAYAVILFLISFIFGPIFCGKLCPAGAFSEYLSKIIPFKWKISWNKYIDITSARYGMLIGFMVLPFFKGILACSYCNLFLFDLLINYFIHGYTVSLTSSLILTFIFWIILFGLFTEGGRGYCNFLCPVGAIQNLFYYFGSKFKYSYKLVIQNSKCIKCKKCINLCPMKSIENKDDKIKVNIHNCIVCGVCIEKCPVKAIKYTNKN